jgi:hypothetical protein
MTMLARLDRLPLCRPHYMLLLMGGLRYTFDGMDAACGGSTLSRRAAELPRARRLRCVVSGWPNRAVQLSARGGGRDRLDAGEPPSHGYVG